MKYVFIAAALLVSASAFADMKAQFATIEATETNCLNSPAGQSDTGQHTCTSQAYSAADAILNNIYGVIMNNLKSTKSQSVINTLIAAEKAWIAYRDADATWQGEFDAGGTLQTLDEMSTDYSKTKYRALELDAYNNTLSSPQ